MEMNSSFSSGAGRSSATGSPTHSEEAGDTYCSLPVHADKLLQPLHIGLVGREQERVVLEQAYDRVCCRVQQAPSEIVLVNGASGVGKSKLVLTSLRESIDREGMGLFVQGKYDLHSLTPYEAIVAAATELCRTVVTSDYLKDIQEYLESVLSNVNDRQLLLNLLPAASSLLIDPSPDARTGSGLLHEFALKRFVHVFCKFWNAVASVHPVVLFLDDLQFADASAREFLTALATDTKSTNLLVVGAFREGTFELNLTGKGVGRKAHLRISNIDLGPLSKTTVNEVVARVTQRRPHETSKLGQVVHSKTNGNALFLWQFLDTLQTSGLLFFSFQTNQWEWETDVAAQTDVADNVAELLKEKLARLCTKTRAVLMLAACLGHSFDPNFLETIVLSSDNLRPLVCSVTEETPSSPESQKESFRLAIIDAINVGLLERISENRLKFSHDAIQQAAFSICPSGTDEDVFHSGLGERVLSFSRTENAEDWMLFSAIDLLTRRRSTVEASQLSRETLAQLCLEVSRKALAKSAFVTAATYADRGYSVLERTDRWQHHCTLCAELRVLSAETHLSYGDHSGAISAASDVLSHANRMEDRFSAQNVLVAISITEKDSLGSIRKCATFLKELGVLFPDKASKIHVAFHLLKVKRLLKGRRACQLGDLPLAKDSSMVQACRLLFDITLPAWLMNSKELALLACFLLMQLTLTHGISIYSPSAFAAYGVTLTHFGKLNEAYEYGCLALQAQEKFGTPSTLTRVLATVHIFLHHLQNPIVTSLEPLEQACENGLQVGDVNFAGRCLIMRVILGIHGSMKLGHLELQARDYCTFLRDYQMESTLTSIQPLFQLVLNLVGKSTNPLVLSGEAIEDESAFVEELRSLGNDAAHVQLQNSRVVLLVLLDELDLADLERRKNLSATAGTSYSKCCNLFFCGLCCLGLARRRKRSGNRLKCRYYERQARKYRKQLGTFVRSGSMNCVPFVKLLDAEALSVRLNFSADTVKRYQDAIVAAARCGFRLCNGLACEKTGQYLLEQGERSMARDYLQRAWNEFSDYGAVVKLSQMRVKYGHVASFSGSMPRVPSRPSLLTKPHSIRSTSMARNSFKTPALGPDITLETSEKQQSR